MKLIVDIGNTNTKYCLWSEDGGARAVGKVSTSLQSFQLVEAELKSISLDDKPLAWQFKDAEVVVVSVVPNCGKAFVAAAKEHGALVYLIEATTQPVLKDMPKEMGADRVAEAIGAWSAYRKEGRPIIIIGFGTASTLFTISADAAVGGGFIGPGVKMLLTALARDCALLPEVRLPESGDVSNLGLGHTTETQMRAGVTFMFKGMVQEWLSQARLELKGEPVIVATGGYSALVARLLPGVFDAVDTTLALKGAAFIAGSIDKAKV